jgi:hypothetical protein
VRALAKKFDPTGQARLNQDLVVHVHFRHYGFDLVEAIGSLPCDQETQIELGWGSDQKPRFQAFELFSMCHRVPSRFLG